MSDARWRRVQDLGRGGMGEVYRARDTRLDRDVAVKLLPNSFLSDPERCARFEREARILATLNHPYIGAIYEFAGSYTGAGRDPAFDVSADGQRFLMIKSDPASTLQSLTIVQNWQKDLERLAQAK
jgi:serine/threonine protein kinase